MFRHTSARLWRARATRLSRRFRLTRLPVALMLVQASLFVARSTVVEAQAAPPTKRDTTRADSAQRIDRVLVSAIRAGNEAPISQKTISREMITARNFAQDVPLLLQGA